MLVEGRIRRLLRLICSIPIVRIREELELQRRLVGGLLLHLVQHLQRHRLLRGITERSVHGSAAQARQAEIKDFNGRGVLRRPALPNLSQNGDGEANQAGEVVSDRQGRSRAERTSGSRKRAEEKGNREFRRAPSGAGVRTRPRKRASFKRDGGETYSDVSRGSRLKRCRFRGAEQGPRVGKTVFKEGVASSGRAQCPDCRRRRELLQRLSPPGHGAESRVVGGV